MTRLSSPAGAESLAESGSVDARAIPRSDPWIAARGRGQYPILRRMLACADVTAALLASLSLVTLGMGETGQLAWALVYLPAWIVVAKFLGLYDRDGRTLRHVTLDEVPQLVLWALIGTSCLSLFLEVAPPGRPDATGAVAAGFAAALSVVLFRAIARRLWRAVTPPLRVGIVASADTARVIRRKFELYPDLHLTIVEEHETFYEDATRDRNWIASVDRVVYAPQSLVDRDVREILALAREEGLMLTVVPSPRDVFGSAVQLDRLAELPLLEYKTSDLSRSTLFLKRVLDVTISGVALVLLLPLFALSAVAIKLDSRGPVFFTQIRAGANGRPFRMLKFRSMVCNAEELLGALVPFDRLEEPMFKLRADPRVTRVGRLLRRWSIDELPQLWNVLVGDMSLVGPRPEQIELVERYEPEHRFRLAIKPGITGPMQVSGRGELTFDERLAVERDYVDNMSTSRDLRILGMTLSAVVRGEGAF